MIDLHCDTIMQLIDHPHDGDLFSNNWKIDIERLIKGHSRLQDFALFVDLEEQDDNAPTLRSATPSRANHLLFFISFIQKIKFYSFIIA